MAEHSTDPAELGAAMDYQEHEATYSFFVALVKYSLVALVSLLIAMAAFFFSSFGFISSVILMGVLCVVGSYLLR